MGPAVRPVQGRSRGTGFLTRRSPARATLALIAALLGAAESRSAEPTRPFPESIRGITLSTHLDGRDWAWDAIEPSMQRIAGTGATWVAIHPYAAIGADGSVRYGKLDPDSPPGFLTRPIREAHRRGLKILIKPHLAYWGGPFKWRGEIDFEQPEQLDRFFREYGDWVEALAGVIGEADGFAVGTELKQLERHEARWREVIRRVRARSELPLTYAANWDSFEDVSFWDALDAIGIQAYFPLLDAPADGSLPPPTRAAIDAGWSRWMARLRNYSERRRRPILFTELGYNRAHSAPYRPWEYRQDGEDAESTQLRCMASALDAIENEPSVLGAFLWKWFPEPRPLGRNFRLATPGMIEQLRRSWPEAAPTTD